MQKPATDANLDDLLAEAGTEACALAREALAAGTPAEFQNGSQPVAPIRSIFGRRERLSRRNGQGSVGFEAALRALGAYPGASLARATIDDRPRDRYLFELFLTPDLTKVIACFGVARPSRDGVRQPDAPPWSRLEEIVLNVERQIGQGPDGVVFTRAFGWRSREWIEIATRVRCQGRYEQDQSPENGLFDPDGPWSAGQ